MTDTPTRRWVDLDAQVADFAMSTDPMVVRFRAICDDETMSAEAKYGALLDLQDSLAAGVGGRASWSIVKPCWLRPLLRARRGCCRMRRRPKGRGRT